MAMKRLIDLSPEGIETLLNEIPENIWQDQLKALAKTYKDKSEKTFWRIKAVLEGPQFPTTKELVLEFFTIVAKDSKLPRFSREVVLWAVSHLEIPARVVPKTEPTPEVAKAPVPLPKKTRKVMKAATEVKTEPEKKTRKRAPKDDH